MKFKTYLFLVFLVVGTLVMQVPLLSQVDIENTRGELSLTDEEKLLEAMHTISSHTLLDYVKELCSEKYGGRLTGSPGYNASAQWVASLLEKWGILPAGDNHSYFQEFPNPYTLVFKGSQVILHIPYKNNTFIEKSYQIETDFYPGSTSGSGEVKAEVVYVGYGITAPELNFDEYRGIDVKGKIVMMEREVPVSADQEPAEFQKWRPYSFHRYKVENAKDHGAAGMLYNYHIVNPNGLYIKDFIIANVGNTIVEDIFKGTGKTYDDIVDKLKKTRKPQSFNTKKIVSIRCVTAHHPEGIGRNVIGYIEGSDPALKNEFIMLGTHLDHLGYDDEMMPGANDNASGVAILLGVAEAIKQSPFKPKRSIIFNFFGAEEQGIKGSEYYLDHPVFPLKNMVGLLNLDSVGRGKRIRATAGKNYPQLWKYIDTANRRYIHRIVIPTLFHNLARPRLDAARFMWAGVPTISFSSTAEDPLPYSTYHTTKDTPAIITPEIMEDLAQLLFIAVMDIANGQL